MSTEQVRELGEVCQYLTAETMARMYVELRQAGPMGFKSRILILYILGANCGEEEANRLIDAYQTEYKGA